MSLFGLSNQEQNDEVQSWMTEIRENLATKANEKTHYYGFDFIHENPQKISPKRFRWEEITDVSKNSIGSHSQYRNSYARSSISTLASLDTEQSEDIPEIGDFNMRVSLETEIMMDLKKEDQKST